MTRCKYHTIGTIPKSNIKILERGNIISMPLIHKYMTSHFPGIAQTHLRYKQVTEIVPSFSFKNKS